MAQRIVDKTGGHKLTGGPLTIPDEINFTTTGNPEIDSSGGNFIHRIKTTSAAAYKVQADTSGTDVILVDSTPGTEIVTLNADLAFATTTSPEIDSTGGSFIWKMVTAIATAWKLRDDTKGQDIITIDTSSDTVTANNTDYSFVGFGSASMIATAKVADYSPAVNGDFILMTTGATTRTVTLPAAATSLNASITVKKVDSGIGDVIIEGNASETIDGQLNKTISAQYVSVSLQCDGTEWWIK